MTEPKPIDVVQLQYTKEELIKVYATVALATVYMHMHSTDTPFGPVLIPSRDESKLILNFAALISGQKPEDAMELNLMNTLGMGNWMRAETNRLAKLVADLYGTEAVGVEF